MTKLPKVLIFGSSGMLWSDFLKTQSDKWDIVKPTDSNLDIRNRASVMEAISSIRPDFVLNCAAYTRVDDAEDIGAKDNYDINSLAVWYIARACRENGCGFVTISSDYVFDGNKADWYSPDDAPNPINAYGMAKYLGERLALEEYPKTVVVRTSWLYGGNAETKNFVNTMVRLGIRGTEVRVVSDQYWAPTFTFDLCETISRIFSEYMKFSGMVLHFSNTTEEINGISWHEFTKGIFKISDIETKLTPLSSEEYPTKAWRPKNSRLITSESLPQIRWKDSLNTYLRP